MQDIFYNILPMFLIALLGSVIRRKWLKSDEFWRGLEKLSFYLLFPAVLFKHSLDINFAAVEVTKLVIALVLSNLAVVLALVIYQQHKQIDPVYFTSIFQGATRYNNYVLFALGAALFGAPGLMIIAAISPYVLILTNITAVVSFAYYIPAERHNFSKFDSVWVLVRSIIANPFILSSLLGMLFNYLEINLNPGLDKTMQNLADSALGIGMLIVGAGMKFSVKTEHINFVLLASLIKLIIMPIVTYITLLLFGVTELAKSVGILFGCLPCATSSYILSRQLGGDPESMSSIITVGTVFSILTLSLLVYILG